MNTRPLGRTGLQVAAIGFGSWQLCNAQSWGAMSDATAQRLVHEAVDGGITLFDTAPNYAGGKSESLLGRALANRRDRVVLVSKFGHTREGDTDLSVPAFWNSLHGSLSRLQTDYLDVLLLHNAPGEIYARDHPLWETLQTAQAQGKIRYFGASLDSAAEADACLANTDCQVLEVLFNVLHQDVRRAFDTIAEHGVGVIAKVPLDSGWLTGRFDARARWSQNSTGWWQMERSWRRKRWRTRWRIRKSPVPFPGRAQSSS